MASASSSTRRTADRPVNPSRQEVGTLAGRVRPALCSELSVDVHSRIICLDSTLSFATFQHSTRQIRSSLPFKRLSFIEFQIAFITTGVNLAPVQGILDGAAAFVDV